jgi:hypothetical protein
VSRKTRRKRTKEGTPTPDDIREVRERAGLTQAQAATLIGRSLVWWQAIEAPVGSASSRRIDPLLWHVWRALVTTSDAGAIESFRGLRMRQRAMAGLRSEK